MNTRPWRANNILFPLADFIRVPIRRFARFSADGKVHWDVRCVDYILPFESLRTVVACVCFKTEGDVFQGKCKLRNLLRISVRREICRIWNLKSANQISKFY